MRIRRGLRGLRRRAHRPHVMTIVIMIMIMIMIMIIICDCRGCVFVARSAEELRLVRAALPTH